QLLSGQSTCVIVAATPSPSQVVPAPDFHVSSVRFAKGSSTPTNIEPLTNSLSGKVKTGDTVLLIGSADCTRSRTPGNTTLASNRASNVRKLLDPAHRGLEVQTIV